MNVIRSKNELRWADDVVAAQHSIAHPDDKIWWDPSGPDIVISAPRGTRAKWVELPPKSGDTMLWSLECTDATALDTKELHAFLTEHITSLHVSEAQCTGLCELWDGSRISPDCRLELQPQYLCIKPDTYAAKTLAKRVRTSKQTQNRGRLHLCEVVEMYAAYDSAMRSAASGALPSRVSIATGANVYRYARLQELVRELPRVDEVVRFLKKRTEVRECIQDDWLQYEDKIYAHCVQQRRDTQILDSFCYIFGRQPRAKPRKQLKNTGQDADAAPKSEHPTTHACLELHES